MGVKRRSFVMTMVILLCLLLSGCVEEKYNLQCSRCGAEIEMSGKGGMVSAALAEGGNVLCGDCSSVPWDLYVPGVEIP